MSSMFKKKGGLAFKPKIPSARPRPAPAAPAPTPKAIDEPVTVDAASQQDIRETIETPHLAESAIASEVTTRASEERPAEPAQSTQQPQAHDEVTLDDATSRQTSQAPAITLSHPEKEIEPTQDHTAIDPSLSEVVAAEQPAKTSISNVDSASQPSASSAAPRVPEENADQQGNAPIPIEAGPQTQNEQTGSSTLDSANKSGAVASAPRKATAAPRPRAKRQASAPTIAGDETDSAKPKKRQRKTTQEDGEATAPRPRQRRTNSDNQVRKRRARSLTPEDAENQVVDLQKLKMSDLTKDLHIGKKFSRHDELRERERKARLKSKPEKDDDQTEAEGLSSAEGVKAKSSTPTDPAAASAAPAAGPQFRIVDGQIIVDQSSLVMDRHARAAAARAGEDMETIEENDFTRLITSSSFMNTSKLKGPNIWNDEETELFYRGLRMFGTDFEIISKMFPHKQRRHIKLKYNREERHNPRRIDAAVMGVKDVKMDIDEYKIVTGSEFEPVENIEAEQRKIAENYEAERKRVADEQEEMMRKKREELFADEDEAGGKKKRGKKRGKQAVAYGLNGEPISTEA